MELLDILSLSGSSIAVFLSLFVFFRTTNRERPRIVVRKTGEIRALQDTFKREYFLNYFNIKFILTNHSLLPNALLNVKVFFWIHDKWVEGVVRDYITSQPSEVTPLPQNIPPLSTIPFNIAPAIKITEGEPGRDNKERSTSHPSLPDPLRFSLEFEMLNGKPVVEKFEYKRTKVSLTTGVYNIAIGYETL